MRAYSEIKFIEGPDIADIKEQGRKSCVGRLSGDDTAYNRNPRAKASIRRSMKRSNKQKMSLRLDAEAGDNYSIEDREPLLGWIWAPKEEIRNYYEEVLDIDYE